MKPFDRVRSCELHRSEELIEKMELGWEIEGLRMVIKNKRIEIRENC